MAVLEDAVGLRWICALVTAGALCVPFDAELIALLPHNPRGLLRDFLFFADFMGGYPIHVLFVLILISWPDRRRYLTGYAIPLIGQGMVAGALKFFVGRARPQLGLGPFFFDPPGSFAEGTTSFPSGDATAAMALATVLGFYFPRSRRPFWILGTAAGLGRVARGQHFFSDVLLGAGLGIACALLAYRYLGTAYYRIPPHREPPNQLCGEGVSSIGPNASAQKDAISP